MVQMPANLTRLPDLVEIEVSPDGYSWSAPVYLNQARGYSFDTNQVGPGNTFRIFGRNLMLSRTPSVRFVDNSDGSSHQAFANPGLSTSYALTVSAPADIQTGHNYAIYLTNGYNGNATTGGETVADTTLLGRSPGADYWNLGVPWAADLDYTANVYNVQTDPRLSQHATGLGSTNDASIIAAAIGTAFRAGGGIVYLPAGTYNLYYQSGCGITLLPRVSVVGAGSSSTFVNFGFGPAPATGQGGFAVCLGTQQAGVSDITFNDVNESGQWPESIQGLGGYEIFLQRTNWNLATAQWVILQNATNMTVQNSTIVQGLDPTYNGPFNVSGSSNYLLRGNTIKYVAGALVFDQSANGVFENNNVTRDASQTPPSYVISHVIVGNFANNLMLLGNSFNVSGGTLSTGNDGETIGSESGGATRYDEFRGTVQSASANSLFDGSQNFNFSTNNAVPNLRPGATVAIVSGQGAGQWGTITSVSADGHSLSVSQPWAVLPAAGSAYATFDWGAANWIIAGNNMANNEKGIEFFDASIRDVLITGNTLTNNGEILVSPTEQPLGSGIFNLVINTQILNNSLIDTNHLRPAAISVVPREDQQSNNFGTSVIGLEVRGNSVTASVPNTLFANTALDDSKALTEGINLYWQWQTIANFSDTGIPSLLGSVVQGNNLTNSAVGLELNTGDYQTVLAYNNFNNVANRIVDIPIQGASHASIGTANLGLASSVVVSSPTQSSGVQVSVFSSTGLWTTEQLPASTTSSINFLLNGVTPVPADYDGDGLVDCALYSNGTFFLRPSGSPNQDFTFYFANPGDLPVPGDYDGDGKADLAVFRPSTGQWFYSPSSIPGGETVTVQTLAVSSDIPAPGDYDGDGKTDIAFYRPSTGTFYLFLSSRPGVVLTAPFSLADDVPVPGDFDGDGETDLAVFRPSNGNWYYRLSSNPGVTLSVSTQGQATDIPVPGDFDGDGKTDFALWRPSNQTWYVILTSNPGTTLTVPMTGLSGVITPLKMVPNAAAVKASLAAR